MLESPTERLKQFVTARILVWDRYDIFTVVAIFTYAILFSYFTVLKHYNFSSYATDLGVFGQAFYTTIFNGKLFYYTAELYLIPSGGFFGVHFSPILFFLLPIYAIYPSPESLLVAQSFLFGLAALPLYLISKEKLKSKKAASILVVVFLLFTPLHGANWFDFHPQAFIPILVFSIFYFSMKNSWKLYFLSVLLALMIQEHLIYILLALSICTFFGSDLKHWIKELHNCMRWTKGNLKNRIRVLFSRRFKMDKASASILTMAMCIGWFLVIKQAKSFYPITPEFQDLYQAKGVYEVLGFEGDISLLPLHVILNPYRAFEAFSFDFHIKFLYVMILFGPLLFLSFRSKLSLVILFILVPMLLTNYVPYYTIGAQYPLYLIPLIFLAAVDGLSSMQSQNSSSSVDNPKIKNDVLPILKTIVVVSMIFMVSVSPLSPLAYSLSSKGFLWYPAPTHFKDRESFVEPLHAMISLIPSDASVLTQNELFPHVCSRIDAYLIPFDIPVFQEDEKKSVIENYTRQLIADSEYVLLNSRATDYWTKFVLEKVSNSSEFEVYALAYSYILFKRNYDGAPLFMPNISYQSFQIYKDCYVSSGQILRDHSSQSGYVAFSEKGVNNGSFVYGPYICLPPGTFNVTFEVRVEDYEKDHLASLDVVAEHGSIILTTRNIYDSEVNSEGWFNVTLTFSTNSLSSDIEFRIFTTGFADVYADRIIVEISQTVLEFRHKTFLVYRDLASKREIIHDESSRSGYVAFSPKETGGGIFVFGPYINLPAGTFDVTFIIKARDPHDSYIGTLDILENYAASILSKRYVYGFEMPSDEWTNFTLSFTSIQPRNLVEFRVFSSGAADLYVDSIVVNRVSSSANANFGSITLNFRELSSVGGAVSNEGIFVHPQNLVSSFFWSGPYMNLIPNTYRATFFLRVSRLPQDPEEKIITLQITADSGTNVISELEISSSDFLNDTTTGWHSFTLEFTVEEPLKNVEFRGKKPSQNCNIYFAFVLIEKAD